MTAPTAATATSRSRRCLTCVSCHCARPVDHRNRPDARGRLRLPDRCVEFAVLAVGRPCCAPATVDLGPVERVEQDRSAVPGAQEELCDEDRRALESHVLEPPPGALNMDTPAYRLVARLEKLAGTCAVTELAPDRGDHFAPIVELVGQADQCRMDGRGESHRATEDCCAKVTR